jgi:hypothetical protein
LQQGQHHVPAAEHQRAGAIEGLEQLQAVARHCGGKERQPEQNREEQNDGDNRRGSADGVRHCHVIRRRSAAQQRNPGDAAQHDRPDLPQRRWNRHDKRGGDDGERRPLAIGRKRTHH